MNKSIRVVTLIVALTLAARATTKSFSPANYPLTATVDSFYTTENGASFETSYVDMLKGQDGHFALTHVRVYKLKTSIGTALEVACQYDCWLSVGQVFPYRTDGHFIWVPFSFLKDGKKNKVRYYEQSYYVSAGHREAQPAVMRWTDVPPVPLPVNSTPPLQLPPDVQLPE